MSDALVRDREPRVLGSAQTREWPVKAITGKRITDDGLMELKADWEPTVVERRQIRNAEDGRKIVTIRGVEHNRIWKIKKTIADAESGEPQAIVHWEQSWRSVWGLTETLTLIDKYHQQNPEKVGAKETQWWKPADLGRFVVDAEGEPGIGARMTIIGPNFFPEDNRDYTLSILAEWFERLQPFTKVDWLHFLNRNVRQRLIFDSAWIELVHRGKKKCNLGRFLKLMLVYVVGLAHVNQCSCCEKGDGPFPKCVTEDGSNMGACVNCAAAGDNKACEFHHHRRRDERPEAFNPDALQEHESLEEPMMSGGLGYLTHSPEPTSPSSEDEQSALSSTPASSQGSATTAATSVQSSPSSTPRTTVPKATNPPESASGRTEKPLRTHRQDGAVSSTAAPQIQKCESPSKRRKRTVSPGRVKSETGDGEPLENSSQDQKRRRRHLDAELGLAKARHAWTADHANCKHVRFRFPCRDTLVGRPCEPKAPVLVHSERQFNAGEASAAEVNDILSHCPCDHAEKFEEMYHGLLQREFEREEIETPLESLAEHADKGEGERSEVVRDLSKERMLSLHCSQELNLAVKMFCPVEGSWRRQSSDVCEIL